MSCFLLVVRARSTIAGTPAVAVEAEDLKSLGEIVLHEPLSYVCRANHFPVAGSIVVDVVDRQEKGLSLAAASTRSAVVIEHLMERGNLLLSVVGQGANPALFQARLAQGFALNVR
jgi:hypothetical protein